MTEKSNTYVRFPYPLLLINIGGMKNLLSYLVFALMVGGAYGQKISPHYEKIEINDVIKGGIEIGGFRQKPISIPQGDWLVVNKLTESTLLTGSSISETPYVSFTFTNKNQSSSLIAFVIEFSPWPPSVNWKNNKCGQNATSELFVNDFGYSPESMTYACAKVFQINLTSLLDNAAGSSNKWTKTRLSSLSSSKDLRKHFPQDAYWMTLGVNKFRGIQINYSFFVKKESDFSSDSAYSSYLKNWLNDAGKFIYKGVEDSTNFEEIKTLEPFLLKTVTNQSNPVSEANTGAITQSNLPVCQGSDTTKWSNCTGTKTFPNDDKYVGEFKDGKLHGQVTGTFANGDKYLGEFKDDKRNGQGTFTFANGNKYVGEFKHNNYNGEGTFTFASGYKYVGEFKHNKFNGQGTLYSSNASIINQGIWLDDTIVRSTVVQQADTPTSVQQSKISNTEIERLRAEAELERKRRQELEEQLRLSQQQTQTTSPTVSVPSIGRRVALVVGNANYKVRPLKNPRNDADDISRSLRSSGFEVIDLRDASLQQMRNGVRQFGDRLINNDVGLVYFSGHGVEVKGRNYFIPVNADIMREDEIADQGLDVSLILEKMNTAGKGVNILIVDACRDDPFGRSFRSSSRGLAQMDAPRGTIIAYATSPGKVASDGDPRERNSPYTKNLIKAMQQPNKPIEQVFKEVRRAVQEETKNQQTPWENTSLSGDFFFRVQK